jgi:hypothetical protein
VQDGWVASFSPGDAYKNVQVTVLIQIGNLDIKVGGDLCPDGRRGLWSTLSAALRDLPGMRHYQVIQEELERFTVRLTP